MLFNYEAFNKNGGIVTGEIDAEDEKGVVLYLESKELIPSKIRAKAEKKAINLQKIRLFEKLKSTDIIFMVRNLATAIKAGLSITEALEILITDAKDGIVKEILTSARTQVRAGRPLSEAFAQYKKYFPPVFIGLLKAGEVASQLDKALEELSDHLIKEYDLVKKIKSAMVYPGLLLASSFGVIIFLLTFVLPRLAKSFALSGTELPLVTRVLLATSNFLTDNFLIFLTVLIASIAGIIYLSKIPKGKIVIATMLFKTPVVSDLLKRIALVRFTRTLGSLLAGASPVLDALKTSSEAVGNIFYKKAIEEVIEKVRSGVPLSKALQAYPELFPTLLVSLIAVGEKTGNIEYVLATFAGFYDQEVQNKLKDLTTLFEPILLITMGLIIGTIAIAVLLPIYSLVGQFT